MVPTLLSLTVVGEVLGLVRLRAKPELQLKLVNMWRLKILKELCRGATNIDVCSNPPRPRYRCSQKTLRKCASNSGMLLPDASTYTLSRTKDSLVFGVAFPGQI